MATTEATLKNEEAILFDFWQKLPVLETYDPELYAKIVEPKPRCDILDILVVGEQEIHPITNESRVRRALTAKEIMEKLNKGIENSDDRYVKKSNLYFHLQKLEDHGIIQVVVQLPTGKRFTTYYGRRAKIITISSKENYKMGYNILMEREFKTFLRRLNPELQDQELDRALNLVDRKNHYQSMTKLHLWLQNHEKELQDLDLDLRRLFDLMGLIIRYDRKTFEGLAKLSQYLKLDEFLTD